MYVITGATGNIGSKIVDNLIERGERVRVIGRSSERLRGYVDRGAEAEVGDLRDAHFVARSFSGATAVFTMIPPNLASSDFRAYQAEITENFAFGIESAGVKYVVNLSSQGADLMEGTGPILGLRVQEIRFNHLEGVNVLHLRPTYFMENLLMNIPGIAKSGIACSAVHGDLKFAMIATSDISSIAAEHLVRRDFIGKQVRDLLGPFDISLNEAFFIIGRRIGMPGLEYIQLPYDDVAKEMSEMGISEDVGTHLLEMYEALNKGLFAVNRPRTPVNTTYTTMEEFADTFAHNYEACEMRKAA